MLERLANVAEISFVTESLTREAGARATSKFEVALVYEKKIDVAAERERVTKDLAKLETQLTNSHKQLGNGQFLAKAPPHVVEGLKKQAEELNILMDKARKTLDALN